MLAAIGIHGILNPVSTHTLMIVRLTRLTSGARATAFSIKGSLPAALQDMPVDVTEAAEVDGARGWQQLVFITLPMIRRSISTNLMLTTLQTLSVFTLILRDDRRRTWHRTAQRSRSSLLPRYFPSLANWASDGRIATIMLPGRR